MRQRVTIWLKETNFPAVRDLFSTQEFSHVISFRIADGVYRIVTSDNTEATFPIRNVLGTLAVPEDES
jgi:hypothetical protein